MCRISLTVGVVVGLSVTSSAFTSHATASRLVTARAHISLPAVRRAAATSGTRATPGLASLAILDDRCPTCAGRMHEPRAGHTATRLPNGKVVLVGGMVRNGEFLASAELYDPSSRSFQLTGSMSVPRGSHTATLLPDGRVLIAGGEDQTEVATRSAEIYDPRSGRFTATGDMTVARAYHVAAPIGESRVLVAGGGPDLHHVLASAEIYDERTGTFAPTADMTVPRRKSGAATLADGRVLILAGADTRDFRGPYASAELYDPSSGAFRATGPLTVPRFKLSAGIARLPDGRVLVAGGGPGAEVYDPASGQFSAVAGAPTGTHYYSTATALDGGVVLVTGGYGDGTMDSDARTWVLTAPAPSVAAASTRP